VSPLETSSLQMRSARRTPHHITHPGKVDHPWDVLAEGNQLFLVVTPLDATVGVEEERRVIDDPITRLVGQRARHDRRCDARRDRTRIVERIVARPAPRELEGDGGLAPDHKLSALPHEVAAHLAHLVQPRKEFASALRAWVRTRGI
jgi:hypothetical protein